MNPYSVLLILPDTVVHNQYGEEFYFGHCQAVDAQSALEQVQQQACNDFDGEAEPEDFAVVAVFAGHLEMELSWLD